MPRFRLKVAPTEAMQFDGSWENAQAILAWMRGSSVAVWRGNRTLVIVTLESERIASPGDWIVREGCCDYVPLKPDAFAAAYESLDG